MSDKQASVTEQSPVKERAASGDARSRIISDTAVVSFFGVIIAIAAYMLNRSIAYRTAIIEAQKLLVEMNKQYIADPDLLLLEEENYNASDITDKKLQAKLNAMAYLKLNIFEVIFAVLPRGPELKTWRAYFEDSLDKGRILADELEKNRKIYHPSLIGEYDNWKTKKKTSTKTPPAQPPQTKSPDSHKEPAPNTP